MQHLGWLLETKNKCYYAFFNLGIEDHIENIFFDKMEDLDKGFKYLGFFLKPNAYKRED